MVAFEVKLPDLNKGELLCHEVRSPLIRFNLTTRSWKNSVALPACARQLMPWCSGPRFFSWLGNIRIGAMAELPRKWAPVIGLFANGANVGRNILRLGMLRGWGLRAFFPSAQRAQITALACTLPVESGRPLSRWSSSELAKEAIQRGIASDIAPSTIRDWLRQEKIKPWQRHAWQKSTDPEFLTKATVVLNLYERARVLARRGEILVCADEKTCMQALTLTGGVDPAHPGTPVRYGARYKRQGVLNLFAGLLVHTGQTMARCFPRKRFMEFQDFLRMIFQSLWTKRIRVLHLILDNGSTHAPKQIREWIRSLKLPFKVRIHWLPVNASWLDQVEIVFSPLERKVLTPRHFTDVHELENRVMNYFADREPKPIQWSYTSTMLRKHFSPQLPRKPVLCAA